MTEIFQYIDSNSIIHRLNPLTKILFCTFIILAGILCNDPILLLGLVAIPIIGMAAAGLHNEIPKEIKMLLPVFVFMMALTMLTVRTGVQYSISNVTIFTFDGALMGVDISLRLAAMFFAFMLLVNTTRPTDLVNTLVSRLHFPMDYALMLMITLRFIPTLQIEARKIREAQAVRGFSATGMKNLTKSIRPTVTPLLSNSLGRAGSLGHIIELRGYHSGSKIKFTDIPLRVADFAFIGLMLAGLIGYAVYTLKLV